MIKKIVIIGNGKIGNAILHLLNKSLYNSKNKDPLYSIDIYDNDSAKNPSGKTLDECVMDANFVFLCIPSWHTKQAILDIKSYLKKDVVLISVTKGIDVKSKQTIDQLLEKNLKNPKYALLSGPMFAVEIMENEMSFAVLASKDKKVFDQISKLFTNSKIKLEYSKEVHAVAISAVLKNVYALIVSMLASAEKGKNTRGYLCSKATEEMIEIMKSLKLNSKISLGTSGLGDFFATVSCGYSQNRKVGEEIFTKGKSTIPSEGLLAFPSLIKILGNKYKKLPLLSLAEKILIENKNTKTEINKFFE